MAVVAPRALSMDQWNDCLDRIRDAERNFWAAVKLVGDPSADAIEVADILSSTVDAALLVLGEIHDATDDWGPVEDAIRELDLEWLRQVVLERAIDTARAHRADRPPHAG